MNNVVLDLGFEANIAMLENLEYFRSIRRKENNLLEPIDGFMSALTLLHNRTSLYVSMCHAHGAVAASANSAFNSCTVRHVTEKCT